MKTVTKHENLKEMEVVELYESIYRNVEDNVECPTYGIKINDIIFEDISLDKDTVKSFVKLINKMMSGNTEAKDLIHCMMVESVSSYDEQIVNL